MTSHCRIMFSSIFGGDNLKHNRKGGKCIVFKEKLDLALNRFSSLVLVLGLIKFADLCLECFESVVMEQLSKLRGSLGSYISSFKTIIKSLRSRGTTPLLFLPLFVATR